MRLPSPRPSSLTSHESSGKRRKGFTLIEILIVSVIFIFLSGGVLLGLFRIRTATNLDRAANAVLSELRLARERTIASSHNTQWGVHFTPTAIELFRGSSYPGTIEERVALPNDIAATWSLAGGGADVIFDRISGTTATGGTVTLTAPNGDQRTITIFPSGETSLSPSLPPPSSTRLTDTRHAHLLLPFSLQSSTTMTLTFSNPPNPPTVETISIPSHMSNGQFLWDGTVDVNGSPQHLRIVSHSMSVSETNLSVTRDRMENTKAVVLAVDGTTIATYAADGTLTPGAGVIVTLQ